MAKNRYKKSNSAGKALIAILLALVLVAGVLCCGYASRTSEGWFKNPNLSTWHWADKAPDEGNGGDEGNGDDTPTTPQINDEGSAELENGESNGIELLSAKIPKIAYAANGISAYSDTAFTITATITPADAVNKAVDWSVAWENAASEWASGKTVTDYVKITPTSDGALTATAACLQAFGERIIITAQVRDGSEDLKATCIANYVEKFLGSDFKFASHADGYTQYDYGWNFTPDNLNPVIDIPQSTSPYAWLCYVSEKNTVMSNGGYYSEVCTKKYRAFGTVTYISLTEEYLAAVSASGFTPRVSAGEYFTVTAETPLSQILFPTTSQSYDAVPASAQAWTAYRNTLRQNVDKVMFRVKCSTAFTVEDIKDTVYNVKISASSLDTLATDIKLNFGEIDF